MSRRIFGTEIAKHYAVIQLVISNHDQGDALIVRSVILDYSHWLFSGTFAALGGSSTEDLSSSGSECIQRCYDSGLAPALPG